jgi:thioredoxin-related protein/YHS domain-containing protein
MRTAYLFALTSAILVTSQFVAPDAIAQEQVPWAASFGEAQEIARAQHKLILLHFSTVQCGPCEYMETTVFPRPDVASAISAAYVPVRAHSSKTPELVRRYRVHSFPTDVIVTASGQEVFRSKGRMDPPKYIAMLRDQAFNSGGLLAKTATPARGDQKPLPPLLTGEDPTAQDPTTDSQDPSEQPANEAIASQREPSPPAVASRPAGKAFNNPHYSPLDEAQAELNSKEGTSAPESSAAGGQVVNNTAKAPTQEESVYGSAEEPSENSAATTDVAETTVPQSDVAPSDAPAAPKKPETAPVSKVAKASKIKLPPNAPPLAMEGRCPVTLQASRKWKTGDPRYGAIHRGRTYLFTDAASQQEFLRDPDTYAPAFCGYDPVHFAERGELTNGSIQFGASFKGKTFLFADAESRDRFIADSQRFDEVVYQAMLTEDMNKSKLR